MPNLIIPFPEGTRTVVLRGSRITVGRLPENTIQLRDRTISAHHAELILEGDHYRIHDLDATNGVLVDGRQVRDFHLHDGCVVRLGSVECKFQTEDPAPGAKEEIESLASRGEVNATRAEIAYLKNTNAALTAQVEAMNAARSPSDDGRDVVQRADKLAEEIADHLRTEHQQREEIQQLREALAIARRERDNLQRAYDEVRNGAPQKAAAPVPETPVATPVTSSAPLAMPPKLPKPPTTLTMPAPATPTSPTRRPASGTQLPPVRVIAVPTPPAPQPVATGPKGTQRLVA